VSDLLTLRFRNLTDGNLSYRMMKTDYPMRFELTRNLMDFIVARLDSPPTDCLELESAQTTHEKGFKDPCLVGLGDGLNPKKDRQRRIVTEDRCSRGFPKFCQ